MLGYKTKSATILQGCTRDKTNRKCQFRIVKLTITWNPRVFRISSRIYECYQLIVKMIISTKQQKPCKEKSYQGNKTRYQEYHRHINQ